MGQPEGFGDGQQVAHRGGRQVLDLPWLERDEVSSQFLQHDTTRYVQAPPTRLTPPPPFPQVCVQQAGEREGDAVH